MAAGPMPPSTPKVNPLCFIVFLFFKTCLCHHHAKHGHGYSHKLQRLERILSKQGCGYGRNDGHQRQEHRGTGHSDPVHAGGVDHEGHAGTEYGQGDDRPQHRPGQVGRRPRGSVPDQERDQEVADGQNELPGDDGEGVVSFISQFLADGRIAGRADGCQEKDGDAIEIFRVQAAADQHEKDHARHGHEAADVSYGHP